MKVVRIVPNLASEAFVASRDFYAAMFDLVVSVEHDDWYLQLMPESDARLNIGPQRGLRAAAFPRGRPQRARVERYEHYLTI
jgi:hypothetical protein